MLCEVDSGNITRFLVMLTGANESEIEKMLMSGIPPWVVANQYGKYEDFKEILKNNIAARLQILIDNEELTTDEANKMYNRINQY